MIVLDNTKTLTQLASDTSNGLGQIHPLSCVVTEELNGIYEMNFTVSVDDPHYEDLKTSGLVKVTVGDGSEQIFRAYYISEPINLVSEVKCQHITYDLSKVIVKPFQATGAVSAKNGMLAHVLGSYPFTMTTDISNTTSTFTLDIPRYFRECLGGYEGSLLDVFRGEYEWDNLTVKMLARRGADSGVRIAYGKNLVDFQQEQNNENVYDAVYGYAVVDDVTYEASSIYNKTGATYPRVKNVDFSSKYESGDVPTSAELLQYATTYATNNSIEVPNVNIKIDFVPLWQTEEYKNILPLERVSLGDTVHVYFEKLNVEASARVIKTEWNVLTQKYDSIELGDAKANLNTIINDSIDTAVDTAINGLDIDVDVSWLDDKLENITTLIANGLGLHISQDSGGAIILHNAETIALSQYQYKITSNGFMLSEDYGVTWSSGWSISGDAVLNSLSTITLRALEIYGSYIYGTTVQGSTIIFGDPTDVNGKYIEAYPYDADGDTYVDGVTFDGTGYVRFQPQEEFVVNNIDSNSNLLNEFVMSSNGTYGQAYVTLKNYDHNNQLLANAINMDDNYGSTIAYQNNRLSLENYVTQSGTSQDGNTVVMTARTNLNQIFISNYQVGNGSLLANRIGSWARSDIKNIALVNYGTNSNGIYSANEIGLSVDNNSMRNEINLFNCKYGTLSYANKLSMFGRPLNTDRSNSLELSNYDVDGDNIANELYMGKSTNDNTTRLRTYRGGNRVAEINMNRASNGTVSITISCLPSSTYGYTGSSITLKSDGTITMYGYGGIYANGTQIA